MNTITLTFDVNGQNIENTSPKLCMASDTVNYVEATFHLGDNWDGFDSVRAVWSNGRDTYATVLDMNGTCKAPTELLTVKSVVKVNLVGSNVVEDELVDRLTTYQSVALNIAKKVPIEGEETDPVTPSQFEQYIAIVGAEVEKVTGMSAEATTLPAGSDATASYEDGVLSFGIPKGDTGATGPKGDTGQDGQDGVGIASVALNSDYTLTITLTDGTTCTTTSIRGEQGETGLTPDFSIGTVTTLAPGSQATATITGTDEDPVLNLGIPKGDPGEVTEADLLKLAVHDEASGSIASFADGSDGFPMDSLKVTLDPKQDLHGYDYPWSGGAGKNKFDDSKLVLSYAPYTDMTFDKAVLIKAGTYIASISNISNATTWRFGFRFFEANGDVVTYPITNQDCAIDGCSDTYSSGTACVESQNGTRASMGITLNRDLYVTACLAFGDVSATTTANYQIEAGSTVTSYEPYSNICPITGWDEVSARRAGCAVTDNSTDFIELPYPIENGETYGFSTLYPSAGDSHVMFYDENKTYVDWWTTTSHYPNENQKTNTYNKTIKYVKLHPTSDSYTKTHYVGVRNISKGEEYNFATYTADLGQTVYGGTLDVVTGELVVDRVSVDMGNLNWSLLSSSRFWVMPNGMKPFTHNISSSQYVEKNVGIGSLNTGEMTTQVGSGEVYVKDERFTTATDFKSAVAGQQLCYELATPQTYQLTPTEIDTILGTNNVWSDVGNVYVKYIADTKLYILKVVQ